MERIGLVQIEWQGIAGRRKMKAELPAGAWLGPGLFIEAAAQDADHFRELLLAQRRGVPVHVRTCHGPDKGEVRRRREQQQRFIRFELLLNLINGSRRAGNECCIFRKLRGDGLIALSDFVCD